MGTWYSPSIGDLHAFRRAQNVASFKAVIKRPVERLMSHIHDEVSADKSAGEE